MISIAADDDAAFSGTDSAVLGLFADPGAPAEIAEKLADELPGLLSELMGDGRSWEVRVICERLPAGERGHVEMMELAASGCGRRTGMSLSA